MCIRDSPKATAPWNRIQQMQRVLLAVQPSRGRAYTTALRTPPQANQRARRQADTLPTRPSVCRMGEGRTAPRPSRPGQRPMAARRQAAAPTHRTPTFYRNRISKRVSIIVHFRGVLWKTSTLDHIVHFESTTSAWWISHKSCYFTEQHLLYRQFWINHCRYAPTSSKQYFGRNSCFLSCVIALL